MIATGPGLICAACGGETAVTDSRPGHNYIRRRRKCVDPSCAGPRVTTMEIIVPSDGPVKAPIMMLYARAISSLGVRWRAIAMALIRELGGEVEEAGGESAAE